MKKTGKRIGNVLKNIFNVRAWLDFDRIRAFGLYLYDSMRFLFVPKKKDDTEASARALSSFEAAKISQNLSDADLLERQVSLYRLSWLMCLAALGLLIYAIYHLFYGGLAAVIISLVLMLVALVLALRYHFWYFQIRERKLGCTLREWYKQGFLGKKS